MNIILNILFVFSAGILVMNIIVTASGFISYLVGIKVTVFLSHPFWLFSSILYQIFWWATYFNLLTI